MSTRESFSHAVKAEAASGINNRKRCDACLAGYMISARELGKDRIMFQTEDSSAKDLLERLLVHAAGDDVPMSVEKIRRSYILTVTDLLAVDRLCMRAGIAYIGQEPSFDMLTLPSEKYIGYLVAGIFLSCGSVVSPVKEYHLEFSLPTERLADDLCTMLSYLIGIDGKRITRKGSHILYFKESEHIEDILTLIGAQKATLELMNVKVYKDIRNRVNRATNCDTANVERQNRSAVRQIEAIKTIASSEGGLSALPDQLRELCELRLENPEMSLGELAALFDPPLSRSGINHRFERIEEYASGIKE